jgi:hypothetical protein
MQKTYAPPTNSAMRHTPQTVFTLKTVSSSRALPERFREVFGEPDNTLGRDDHRALKCDRYAVGGRDILSINVLVGGMSDMPAVWVFDPNSRDDGMMRIAVKDQAHLEDIINQIQERVKKASLPRSTG